MVLANTRAACQRGSRLDLAAKHLERATRHVVVVKILERQIPLELLHDYERSRLLR